MKIFIFIFFLLSSLTFGDNITVNKLNYFLTNKNLLSPENNYEKIDYTIEAFQNQINIKAKVFTKSQPKINYENFSSEVLNIIKDKCFEANDVYIMITHNNLKSEKVLFSQLYYIER